MLDEELGIYNEEDVLCRRVKNAGWTIYYFPEAEIIHYGCKTSEKPEISDAIPLLAYRSKLRFYGKYYGSTAVWVLIVVTKLVILLEIAKYIAQYVFSRNREAVKRKVLRRWRLLKA